MTFNHSPFSPSISVCDSANISRMTNTFDTGFTKSTHVSALNTYDMNTMNPYENEIKQNIKRLQRKRRHKGLTHNTSNTSMERDILFPELSNNTMD